MLISPADNIKYSQNINFKSCLRKYSPLRNPEIFSDKEYVKTTTGFFRSGSNLSVLADYIILHFSDKPKVNIYSLTSSDGSEPYSLAILLAEQFINKLFGKFLPLNWAELFCKEKFGKYFPIHASDIDSKIIDYAQKRRINIREKEFNINKKLFKKYFRNREKYAFIENDYTKTKNLYSYKPVKLLQKSVEFQQSDILTKLNSIKDEGNTVVICTNAFPYLKEDYINKVLASAKMNLKSGSLFVIGDFDYETGIQKKLKKLGFFNPMPEFSNLFQKQ